MVIDMNYWSKVAKKLIIIILTIIGLFLGFKIAMFYVPFLIAFILSMLLEPCIRFFMKKFKFKRRTSSIIVFIFAITIIIGLVIWGTVTLVQEASNLLGGLNGYIEKAGDLINNLSEYINSGKIKIPNEVQNIVQNSTNEFLSTISVWIKDILTRFLNTITSIPTIGFYIVICILALYFICTDKIYMIDQLEHHLPETWVKRLFKHVKEIAKKLGCYLKAEATLILVSFVISLIGLYIFKFAGLNIEYPLLIALGIGFVDALPIFGSGTVMLPWAIISGINGDITLALCILGLLIFMSIVRQFLEPRLVSKELGIHPIFTLIAMYTGFRFIGVFGMLLGPILLIVFKDVFAELIDKGVLKSIFERE